MNIYLKPNIQRGLMTTLQLLEVGESFMFHNDNGVPQQTQTQSSLSKINRKRKKHGKEPIRVNQKQLLIVDPKSKDMIEMYLIERTE